jgi:hypothetical protein
MRSISTSCEVLGYTEEAAKKAWQNCFAMTDHFGLSSLFLTTTPCDCDECSFRVRLFANQMGQVRTNLLAERIQQIKPKNSEQITLSGTTGCI